MPRTYTSQIPQAATCQTPYCGSVYKYFCVKCRHYVEDCRCQPGYCACETREWWAATGERPMLRRKLQEESYALGEKADA